MSKKSHRRDARSAAEPTQRQLRVGEQLRHIIAETLQRGHFHEEILMDAGKVTVTEVRVSPDLKNATAYVIALGGAQMDEILPALNESAQIFQKAVNKHSNLKFTPRVRFVLDKTFDQAQRIDQLLHSLDIPEDDEAQGDG